MSRTFVLDDGDSTPGGLDLASDLNDEQRAVVTAGTGPILVIAGAGSGKTRALTYRVAHLIASGTPAGAILLLTFTNRAASEMLSRVRGLVGPTATQVWGGTFHSVARRILSLHAEALGYPAGFGILDREDSEILMKQAISEEVTNPTELRFPKPRLLINVLSRARNTKRTTRELIAAEHPAFTAQIPVIEQVFLRYQGKKFEYGVMDFDDLLQNWRRLMVEHPEIQQELASRFEHVLVDEYQDTNAVQAELVDLCSSVHGNLTVVGDDCQSIYSFRGAEFRNILEFPERHPGTTILNLNTNYRSTPEILAMANASIACNPRQYPKELLAVRPSGLLPGHVHCASEDEQSAFVAQRTLQLRDEGVPLDQIAVLYRAHWQSMALQLELGKRNIPFRVHSGQRFFEQRHIKELLAFLRFAQNPRDELAFQRMATLYPGIGPKRAAGLYTELWSQPDTLQALLEASHRGGTSQAAESSRLVSALGADLLGSAESLGPSDLIQLVQGRFFEQYVLATYERPENRLRDIEALMELASRYESLELFLQEMALAGEVSGSDRLSAEESDESMVLSTIHQAKGLEFHTVFLLWASEDRFPSPRARDDELEEERRLFYVAVTRARQELYLMSPLSVWERGKGLVVLRDSLFLRELEGHRPPVFERIRLVRAR